jgi:hypothetical protein
MSNQQVLTTPANIPTDKCGSISEDEPKIINSMLEFIANLIINFSEKFSF